MRHIFNLSEAPNLDIFFFTV